jgi:hypothetical protein
VPVGSNSFFFTKKKQKLTEAFADTPIHSGESLGTPHLSPFMKPLGSNYSHGVNFAIAGSTATPGATTFSLDVQVDQFVFFKERCLDLIERGLLSSSLLFFFYYQTSLSFFSLFPEPFTFCSN